MGLKIGRLQLGPPSVAAVEPVGDPIGGVGGAVVAAPRVPQQLQLQLNTIVSGATTVAQSQTIRRQLRSMLNNSPLKFQGYLYVAYDDDPELNGWYVPDASTLESRDATAWVSGLWETGTMNFSLVGHLRTHRAGRQVWMKDLTTGDYQRDTLGWIYSTEFASYKANWITAGQPAPQLVALPPGASGVVQAVANQTYQAAALPAARDGSQSLQLSGAGDLVALVYDWPEVSMNQADVVVYDRRGQLTAPATGPDIYWEEVYGPDYPWNWLTTYQPNDCPVLDSGLVRVRYDATGTQGFRVDVWNGSAYAEQGKMIVVRRPGTVNEVDNTFVSSWLREYTPDRAVIGTVWSNASDPYSRETIFVTLQRGQLGVTFEVYPAVQANGTQADVQLIWTPTTGASNDSLFKSDSQASPTAAGSGQIIATAGTGSALFSNTPLGATNFSGSENFVAWLRCVGGIATPGPYQHDFAVVQGANLFARSDSSSFGTLAYGGAATNDLVLRSQNNAGYVQAQVSFATTTSDQVNEAETVRNTGSASTSQVSDANASNGLAVKENQATATHATLTKVSNLLQAKYRFFARVHVDGGVGSFQVSLGATQGVVATSSALGFAWLDLGDVLAPSANPQLNISAWGGSLSPPSVTGTLASGSLLGTHYWMVTATNASGQTVGSNEIALNSTLSPPSGLIEQGGTGTWTNNTQSYYWMVTAVNANGETTQSNEATALMTSGGPSAKLSWNAVSGATSYSLYRGNSPGGELTGNKLVASGITGTTYTDTGAGTTTQPLPATNTATVAFGALLSWTQLTGATGYKVYRSAASGGETTSPALVTTISSGSTVTYTDTGTATTSGAAPTTNTASGGTYIDRYEAFLVEDRTRGGNIFIGARDQAQAALFDARVLGVLASR